MQSSSEFIHNKIKDFFEKSGDIYVAPQIPEKKLNNATKAFKIENYKNIVALYDFTFFGAADEGIVFMGEKMVARGSDSIKEVFYRDIEKAEYRVVEEEIKPGKIKQHDYFYIHTKEGEEIDFGFCLRACDYQGLENFINALMQECDVKCFRNEDVLKPIDMMSDKFKEAYLKVVINMTFFDDGDIDGKEWAEIFSLMTRINLNSKTRMAVREYALGVCEDNMLSVEELLAIMKKESEPIQYKSSLVSLVKDLVSISFSTKEEDARDLTFIKKYQGLFETNDEQLDFICVAVENDYKFLMGESDDDKMKLMITDLSAKAVGVGVPIGAVYLSGSVVGLSAAGMTSGLATLGMGGILGFSSMATGVGVVALLGVGTYQAIKFLTSDKKESKYKTRELMLKAMFEHSQKTITHVIEDINSLVQKLNDVVMGSGQKDLQIRDLVRRLAQFQAGLSAISHKGDEVKNIELRLRCPKVINVSKLKKITSGATRQEYYDFIISSYEKSEENEDQMVLKKDIPMEVLEGMGSFFEAVKY